MQDELHEIFSVMLPLPNMQLLLPSALVSEISVVKYMSDTLLQQQLCRLWQWREMHIPLVNLSIMQNAQAGLLDYPCRIAVLKCTTDLLEPAFFAIPITGIARQQKILPGCLTWIDEPLPDLMRAKVQYNNDIAYIPDMLGLEQFIAQASSDEISSLA